MEDANEVKESMRVKLIMFTLFDASESNKSNRTADHTL
jgi:hypothetical protein